MAEQSLVERLRSECRLDRVPKQTWGDLDEPDTHRANHFEREAERLCCALSEAVSHIQSLEQRAVRAEEDYQRVNAALIETDLDLQALRKSSTAALGEKDKALRATKDALELDREAYIWAPILKLIEAALTAPEVPKGERVGHGEEGVE